MRFSCRGLVFQGPRAQAGGRDTTGPPIGEGAGLPKSSEMATPGKAAAACSRVRRRQAFEGRGGLNPSRSWFSRSMVVRMSASGSRRTRRGRHRLQTVPRRVQLAMDQPEDPHRMHVPAGTDRAMVYTPQIQTLAVQVEPGSPLPFFAQIVNTSLPVLGGFRPTCPPY